MQTRGIDVSQWNGNLDWAKIKSDGVSFAIIRAGYGRYQVDNCFYDNITGSLAQGIPVGIYWFSYALSKSHAKQEAKKCLETIEGYKITLPVFYDFEYDTIRYAQEQGVSLGKTEYNEFACEFLKEIETAGYKPGIYYNLDYYRNMVDPSSLSGYPVWYAQYASAPSISDYAIWQYTSSGTIAGISGQFDLNELKDTSLLEDAQYTGPTGWQKDSIGWWYVHTDGSYTTDDWEKIDGVWYYFDEIGYMLENKWIVTNRNSYYLGSNGAMVTDRTLKINSDGKLVPAGGYYETLGEVPAAYRQTLDKLVNLGYLRGTGGSGDSLKLQLGEDTVRALVILDRAGVFEDQSP